MMMHLPRPLRVLALTRRELQQDLKGRRWISVPALLVALLLPASFLRSTRPAFDQTLWVSGDVPAEILALDDVEVQDNHTSLRFDASDPDQLRITGPRLPKAAREALDRTHPEASVRIEPRLPPSQLPRRGLFLSLLAASGLTASIASSIGTERSRRTLGTLLAASITPLEIVLGKLTAWGGLATLSTLVFTVVAVLRGVLDPGWWMLPVAVTPGATVALGLWSVRHAPDVVSATTTALRVMPVIAMVAGIGAAALGVIDPLLGAMVPLGGVICTAGEMWTLEPARDALVATTSTVLATAAVVLHTAHTLREQPSPTRPGVGWTAVPVPAGLLVLTGFCTMVAPALWGLAGNPGVTEGVTPEMGTWALTAMLLATTTALALRHSGGRPFVELRRPGPKGWLGAAAGSAVLVVAAPALGLVAEGSSFLGVLASAFHTGFVPQVAWPAALALILAEELLFRGIMAPRMGHGPSAAAWALAKAPLDPVATLLSGVAVGTVGRTGGMIATVAMRLVWYVGLVQ